MQLDRESLCTPAPLAADVGPGGGCGGGSLSWTVWTGGSLSTPLAADFGPGPEGAAGRGVRFLRLPPSTWGLARTGRRRGSQLEKFLSTPRAADFGPGPGVGGGGTHIWTGSLPSTPLAADFGPCPEGEGGGARCLGPEFAFLSFTHRPLDARPSYAWSLVPKPSKTVEQTLPP